MLCYAVGADAQGLGFLLRASGMEAHAVHRSGEEVGWAEGVVVLSASYPTGGVSFTPSLNRSTDCAAIARLP